MERRLHTRHRARTTVYINIPGGRRKLCRAVNLSAAGQKNFFQCFEQRMNSLITHPVFDYKVSYRRALELQFRILARVLTGEIPEYIPFLTR